MKSQRDYEIEGLRECAEMARARAMRASRARIVFEDMSALDFQQTIATLGIVDAHSYRTSGHWVTAFRVEFQGDGPEWVTCDGGAQTLSAATHQALGNVADWYAKRATELEADLAMAKGAA